MSPPTVTDPERVGWLLARAMARAATPFERLPERLVVVDFDTQTAHLVEKGRALASWPVSTARALGGETGSNLTPPGWHRVLKRIGADAPDGAVFRSREWTGDIWRGEASDEDLILTRVLTLEGLEAGVNLGGSVDSTERCIYLHGTNREDLLGAAVSHGCIRMAKDDLKALFERVAEGDPVVVVEGAAPLA